MEATTAAAAASVGPWVVASVEDTALALVPAMVVASVVAQVVAWVAALAVVMGSWWPVRR